MLVVSKQEATEGWVFLFLLCVWSVYFPTNFDVFLYVPYTLSCMYYVDTFSIKSGQNGTKIQNSHEFVDLKRFFSSFLWWNSFLHFSNGDCTFCDYFSYKIIIFSKTGRLPAVISFYYSLFIILYWLIM